MKLNKVGQDSKWSSSKGAFKLPLDAKNSNASSKVPVQQLNIDEVAKLCFKQVDGTRFKIKKLTLEKKE